MRNEINDLDLITVLSFIIGLKNLDLNISQNDLQQVSKQLDHHLVQALQEIHEHLRIQDEKIDYIISLLEENDEISNV